MNRKSKSSYKVIGTMTLGLVVVTLTFSNLYAPPINAFCSDLDIGVLDKELPVSHPSNKCAVHNSQGVSWSAWMAGRSSSYQFHFIDLLELLSRSSDSAQKSPTKTK